MPPTPVSSLVLFLAVVTFVAVCAVLAVRGAAPTGQAQRWTVQAVAAVGAWMLATMLPTALGLVSPAHLFPGMPLLVGSFFVAVGVVVFSPLGGRLASTVPLWALVAFQGFRLPLEVVLHQWAVAGVAPPQMTWTGDNIDIVAGGVSLALAPLVPRWRGAAWVAQAVGIVLLLNVIRVVASSLPTPLQAYDAPLLLPFRVPHVWIASVCVVGALIGHGLALRALWGGRAARA